MIEATMIVDHKIAWDDAPDRVVFKHRPWWPVYVQERTCEVECADDVRMCSLCGYHIGPHDRYCSHCGARVVG